MNPAEIISSLGLGIKSLNDTKGARPSYAVVAEVNGMVEKANQLRLMLRKSAISSVVRFDQVNDALKKIKETISQSKPLLVALQSVLPYNTSNGIAAAIDTASLSVRLNAIVKPQSELDWDHEASLPNTMTMSRMAAIGGNDKQLASVGPINEASITNAEITPVSAGANNEFSFSVTGDSATISHFNTAASSSFYVRLEPGIYQMRMSALVPALTADGSTWLEAMVSGKATFSAISKYVSPTAPRGNMSMTFSRQTVNVTETAIFTVQSDGQTTANALGNTSFGVQVVSLTKRIPIPIANIQPTGLVSFKDIIMKTTDPKNLMLYDWYSDVCRLCYNCKVLVPPNADGIIYTAKYSAAVTGNTTPQGFNFDSAIRAGFTSSDLDMLAVDLYWLSLLEFGLSVKF
jgi:hypothetical protein